MTLLSWQQVVRHLLKLPIALLNVTLMADCAARRFSSLRDDLLRLLRLVRNVRLGRLCLNTLIFKQFCIRIIQQVFYVTVVRRLIVSDV